jgi:Fe-S cluster assembly ATP-binding protein
VSDVTASPATERSHVLTIEDLRAEAGGREVLHGVDLEVRSGEVHAVMGPNGSGKSTLAHALMGRPGTTVTGGRVTLDGTDLLALPSWERARAGLFLALQQPIEVPGVGLEATMAEALAGRGDDWSPPVDGLAQRLRAEAAEIGFDERFLLRPLNVDLSGGERKRNEMVQLGTLRPRFAVLDEIDSGLDVDALSAVGRRLEAATSEWGLGVMVVTHFLRILTLLRADRVHVLVGGRIADSGGPELAEELEREGYARFERR